MGQREIPKQDFMAELSHAKNRYQSIYGPDVFSDTRGAQVLAQLKAQIVTRLISDHIKLQECERAGYQLPTDKIERAKQEFLNRRKTTLKDFKKELQANGYDFSYFEKKFSQRVRLESYIEERIVAGSIDQDDRQQRYRSWLANTRTLAKVVYYDKALEALVQSANISGGCSGGGKVGSCSGGNCSAAR